jgi:hypothetical protein
VIATVKIGSTVKPVLIFGGGYDPLPRTSSRPLGSDSQGRAVYMVDAITGAPIWSAVHRAFGSRAETLVVTGMDFSVACRRAGRRRRRWTESPTASTRSTSPATCGGSTSRIRIRRIGRRGSSQTCRTVRHGAGPKRKFLFGPDVVLGGVTATTTPMRSSWALVIASIRWRRTRAPTWSIARI